MKLLQMPVKKDAAVGGTLPTVWATEGALAHAVELMQPVPVQLAANAGETGEPSRRELAPVLAPETAFYRSYTEAMLRRYAVLRMESGRVPSMLGRDMFRGKVTSYRVRSFDDVVIFFHDVEGCIRLLGDGPQRLIHRIGVQEYTFAEAARMLGMSHRTVQRRYFEAVDQLTAIFLKRRLLERMASDPCQGTEASAKVVSHTPRAT